MLWPRRPSFLGRSRGTLTRPYFPTLFLYFKLAGAFYLPPVPVLYTCTALVALCTSLFNYRFNNVESSEERQALCWVASRNSQKMGQRSLSTWHSASSQRIPCVYIELMSRWLGQPSHRDGSRGQCGSPNGPVRVAFSWTR